MLPIARNGIVVLIGVSLLLFGSRGADACQPAQLAPDESLARVQSEAPAAWSAFVAWVEKEIQTPRPPAAFPAQPKLSPPRWPCVRLETLVDEDDVKCAWQPRRAGPQALLKLGPYNSATQTEKFRIRRSFHRKRGYEMVMTVQGFEIRREVRRQSGVEDQGALW